MESEHIEVIAVADPRVEEKENDITKILRQLNWHSTDTVWISFITVLFLLPACYLDIRFTFSFSSGLLHFYVIEEIIVNILMCSICTPIKMLSFRLFILSAMRSATVVALVEDLVFIKEPSNIYYSSLFSVFTMLFCITWFQFIVVILKNDRTRFSNPTLSLFIISIASSFSFYFLLYVPLVFLQRKYEVYVGVLQHIGFAVAASVCDVILLLFFSKIVHKIIQK